MKKGKLYLTALCLMQFMLAQSQTNLQNNGIFYISGGSDIVYINGAFTNAATASLTNNGNLHVRQDLTNNQAGMAAGTGTLYLNGSIAQILGGTQTFRTNHLNTNNSSGIALNINLSVAGLHTFANGIITTSATPNYLVYEAGSSYTGATDSRHVNGWVKKIGSSNFTFPVGNGTYLRDVSLSNLSASSEFNCKHNLVTPNTTNVAAPILLVDNFEYWDIPRVSGGTAQVTMNWDNSKISFPNYVLSEIRTVNYATGLWNDRGGSASGDVTTTGVITSNIVSDFGLYTFGSMNWTVPVRFLHFTAQRRQNYTQLDWSISRDVEADRFEVERSDDAVNFRKIGTVAATGGQPKYQYNDHIPLAGKAWYRIRSIDKFNKPSYSSIALVSESGNGEEKLYIVNNPVHQFIYVAATGRFAGNYEYQLFNAAGQLMQKGSISILGGFASIPLSNAVAPGVYIVDLQNKQHRLSQKLVVR